MQFRRLLPKIWIDKLVARRAKIAVERRAVDLAAVPAGMEGVLHARQQFGPCPVGRPELRYRAVGSNEHNVHGMHDLAVFFFVLQAKILGQTMQIGGLRGSKVPM